MNNDNNVVLRGNLTDDVKALENGRFVGKIAINKQYKDKQTGELVKQAMYVNLYFAGFIRKLPNLKKGDYVQVQGEYWNKTTGNKETGYSTIAGVIVSDFLLVHFRKSEQDLPKASNDVDENQTQQSEVPNETQVDLSGDLPF